MMQAQGFPITPQAWLRSARPDEPVLFFAPHILRETAETFSKGFPGQVTYAVKANPSAAVLQNLVAAGLTAFDVASVAEMAAVRDVAPDAQLHYHNPVRSEAEIAAALGFGIASWSVDRPAQLAKLNGLPKGSEIAVRLCLPVPGAAYCFGSKFGAGPDEAAALLRQVAEMGFCPSLTFHPGTQCTDPKAWQALIATSAAVARDAGVQLKRLNVGGGFAAERDGAKPNLAPVFAAIRAASQQSFATPPDIVCEPGRAMVADCMTLALRVKHVEEGAVFLNDGVYGHLAEWRDMPPVARLQVITPQGRPRLGQPNKRIVFGPTCDSLDRLPDPLPLPDTLTEGDYLLIPGMGAYSTALICAFNGYGQARTVTIGQNAQTPSGQHRAAI
ncbi:MAG: type III PLP-dependent enzyme [Paracoccaceae bacterium]|nr:type III PLP-dependent enzyme [Paracoccaceae bacterium]